MTHLNPRVLLWLALLLHAGLLATSLNRPFTSANEDDNAVFGLGASNLARLGFVPLRFGNAPVHLDDARGAETLFYTHHPQGLIVPTALIYRAFGISEATTRAAGMALALVSLVAFYHTIRLAHPDPRRAPVAVLVYALLPGVVHTSSSLSEKTYVLAFSNLLAVTYFLLERRATPLRRAAFLAVLVAGGLAAWHFFFAAAALWVHALTHRTLAQRRFFVVTLPVVALLTFAADLAHLRLLRPDALAGLVDIFHHRSQRLPMSGFLERYGYWLHVNFTWPAVLAALGVLGHRLFGLRSERRLDLSLVYGLQAALVVMVFPQWSTHGFGPIYWAPFVALAFAAVLLSVWDRGAPARWLAGLLAALYLACVPLESRVFQTDHRLMTRADAEMLTRLRRTTPASDVVAMGKSNALFCYPALVEWYLRRNVHDHDWERGAARWIVALDPRIGPAFQDEYRRMENAGYRRSASGVYLVVLSRP